MKVIAERLESVHKNAGVIQCIFDIGDLEMKASAACAAAELGASHNRWYVMQRVVKMCGPRLADAAASRIAIEIEARDLKRRFARCAEGISLNAARAFHPAIARVLKD